MSYQVTFGDEHDAIRSDEYHHVHEAYLSINEKRRSIPDDPALRVRADTLAGTLSERLSILVFRDDDALGKEHHSKARSHYYWAVRSQHAFVESDPMNPNTRYHEGRTLFNWGRTKVLEGLLELVPYEGFPHVYRYLDEDRRNHEGISRYMFFAVDSQKRPTLTGPVLADGSEGVGILRDMDKVHRDALPGLSNRIRIGHVLERTQRADRLRESFIRLIRFLDDR